MSVHQRFLSVLAVLAVGLGTLIPAAPASAQQAAGFTVSPPLWDQSAGPGETIQHTYIIANSGDSAFDLVAQVRNFVASAQDGQAPEFTDQPTGFELARYTTVTPSQFTVPANGSAEIKVQVKFPPTASPGGHYGAITFHSAKLPSDGNVKIDQAVTSLILAKVSGDIKTELQLYTFSKSTEHRYAGVYISGPISFNAAFVNRGNVHVQPELTLDAKNVIGVGSKTIHKPNAGYTLPASTRNYPLVWKSISVPGYYKVKLTATYLDGQQTITHSTSVIVLPEWFLAVVGGVIVLLLLIILVRVRRAHRAKHGKQKKSKKQKPKRTFKFDVGGDAADTGDNAGSSTPSTGTGDKKPEPPTAPPDSGSFS